MSTCILIVVSIYSLFTEVIDGLPVVLMDREPFTVSRTNVNVY